MAGKSITADIISTKGLHIENWFIKEEINFKITYLTLPKVL